MKLYICWLTCLATVGSVYYSGDIKMTRLTVVTSLFSQRLCQKVQFSDVNSASSPFSVHMVLANLALGASRETWNELDKVLELHRFTGGAMKPHEAHGNINEEYRKVNTSQGTVYIASYLSVSSQAAILPTFLNNTRLYYPTEVSSHNQSEPLATQQKINDYIKNKTGGYIKDIIKPGNISIGAEIVLASALYVSVAWQKPFDKQSISKKNFYPTTGRAILVDMLNDRYRKMRVKNDFLGADMVELPCAGNRYSMYFLQPQDGTSMASLEKSLTEGNNSKKLFENLEVEYFHFSVPLFQVESTYEMSSALKDMGLLKAFDQTQADFRPLTRTSGVHFSNLFHKAVMAVNENGTGAVPAAVFTERSSFTFYTFTLDSPFIYFLRDNVKNLILVQGKFTGK